MQRLSFKLQEGKDGQAKLDEAKKNKIEAGQEEIDNNTKKLKEGDRSK